MSHYIGIDLGTTNSAICSFDGRETHVWKSPEQADVTPSAIYIDRRGHRFYGRKAFEKASGDEKNAATLFKRYLGTNKVFHFADAGLDMTPVECSAQLLKVLYGYLPQEIREDPETVTVITVPSAFNQMKKDATLEAAGLAGIGKTALMQEPVAAVMSVLKKDPEEQIFLIYDLGGGTFDISVARHIGSHVSLLAQGGREMCGGRDMDRWIYRNKILPWLRENFALPEDPDTDPAFLSMKRTALFAAEEAKIALSGSEGTVSLWVDEDRLAAKYLDGKEMYLDLTLTREDLKETVEQMALETVSLTRETMKRAGVTPDQVGRIVFIGGPTMYAPLRERVCQLLDIGKGLAVNPMTAVAEGAGIYAESIDWSDQSHKRRQSVRELSGEPEETGSEESGAEQVTIRYETRTSDDTAGVALIFEHDDKRLVRIFTDPDQVNTENEIPAYDSGEISIKKQGVMTIPLPDQGIYHFILEIYRDNEEQPFEKREIEIRRTLASIESIPASHSIAVKALDGPNGDPVPVYLVRANEALPKSGTMTFYAARQLIGGSSDSLSFSLWEGEIPDPIDDNRYIGTYKIPGIVVSGRVVPVGTEIICDYEINEAGNLRLGVSIPSISVQVKGKNFYSRFEGQVDLSDTLSLIKEVNQLLKRTAQMKQGIVDEELDQVRRTLMELNSTLTHTQDQETVAEAENRLMECYRRVAILHQRYGNVIRSRDLNQKISLFNQYKNLANEDEKAEFKNLEELARFSIDMGSSDFESQINEMSDIIGRIMWRQDGVIRNAFLNLIIFPGNFSDRAAFDRLKAEGQTALENKDMNELRRIVNDLYNIRIEDRDIHAEKMFDEVGIYRS